MGFEKKTASVCRRLADPDSHLNPRGAGVSSHLLLAGGKHIPPPSNSRTNWRSGDCEVEIESSQRGYSNAVLKFSPNGKMSVQGQVKCQS